MAEQKERVDCGRKSVKKSIEVTLVKGQGHPCVDVTEGIFKLDDTRYLFPVDLAAGILKN